MSLIDFTRFSLASESPHLELTQRRRVIVVRPPTVLPAGVLSTLVSTLVLQDTLVLDDALQIEYFNHTSGYSGVDVAAPSELVVSDYNILLVTPALTVVFVLTTPSITTLAPSNRTSTIVQGLPLFYARDMNAILLAQGVPPLTAAASQPLQIRITLNVFNGQTTNANQTDNTATLLYRVVHGLQEG